MANLVTFTQTTLTKPLSKDSNECYLASTSGLIPGVHRLVIDAESMAVTGLGPSGGLVFLRRGQDLTLTGDHADGTIVWVAEPHQLYDRDPLGLPPDQVLYSPWINLRTGAVWFAQGDATGAGVKTRWWQQMIATRTIDGLGFRQTTYDPTASSV